MCQWIVTQFCFFFCYYYVYCASHVPKTGPGKLDGFSVGIKAALNVTKKGHHLVNDQIRGSGSKPAMGADALYIKQGMHEAVPHSTKPQHYPAGHFDASALHIQHPVNQTKMNRNGVLRHSVRPGIESRINEFLVSVHIIRSPCIFHGL